MWDMVREIKAQGKTVFLTTHFMEEAERLCDRVAIVHHGKIVALDSPQRLVDGLGEENRVIFETTNDFMKSSSVHCPVSAALKGLVIASWCMVKKSAW